VNAALWVLAIVTYTLGVTIALIGVLALIFAMPGQRIIGVAWLAVAVGTFTAVLTRTMVKSLCGTWQ
jgi:hypothetical protein